MIQIDMEMPKGCVVEINATTRKLCPLMESCHEKGQTIQRNSRPSDCPLKEVNECETENCISIKDIEQVLSDIDKDKRNNSTELWYKDMCCDSDSGWAFEGMEFLLNVLKRYWGNKI